MGVTSEPFGGTYRGCRVLVTGHDGFKGSWLTLWLRRLGAQVMGFSIGPPSQPSLAAALGMPRLLPAATGDIRDRSALAAAVAAWRPDIVFHLAAQALVLPGYDDPAGTFATNVMGTVNVLDVLRDASRVRGAVLATTDKCYLPGVRTAFRESDRLGGDDPYSASKAAAELAIAAYTRSFPGLPPLASVRAGNVIGGGDWGAGRLVPDLVRAALDGRNVELRHPGAVRPWQHVLEPLAGYLDLGRRILQGDPLAGGAWNFGPSPTATPTVLQLAELFARSWPGGAPDPMTPPPTCADRAEQPFLALDPGKARRTLRWSCLLDFEESVRWTVDWYVRWARATSPADVSAACEEQLDHYESLGHRRQAGWVTSDVAAPGSGADPAQVDGRSVDGVLVRATANVEGGATAALS